MGIFAVTGAASGIGAATESQLKALGHEVVSIDIRDADVNGDLSRPEARRQAVAAILQKAPGGLDGLVTCAGVSVDVDSPGLIPRVNFFGSVDLVEGLKPALAMRRGAVVLVSSNSAWLGKCDDRYLQALLDLDEATAVRLAPTLDLPTVYIGAKQSLCRWMRRNNADYAQLGIRMNAIAPGFTHTKMTETLLSLPAFAAGMRDLIATTPLGRTAEPADQADAILFLLSERARFISGSVLYVDGGYDALCRPDQF